MENMTTEPKVEKKAESEKAKHKMMLLTLSGSFKTQPGSDVDRCQYNNVKGVVEFAEYEYYIQFGTRMLPVWLAKDKRYMDTNYEGRIKVYVDDSKEVEGTPICLGKDIKEMTWEELMSLACFRKLREIPLYKDGDIRKARERAYIIYEEKINGRKILKNAQELKKFKEKLEQAEYSEVEIEKRVGECLNLTQDEINPIKSYNFAKLPPMIVKG